MRPAYSELGEGQWRENLEVALEVLFIKRGQWPLEGNWALPGGFIRPTETVDEGAGRELREAVGIKSRSPCLVLCNRQEAECTLLVLHYFIPHIMQHLSDLVGQRKTGIESNIMCLYRRHMMFDSTT